MDSDRCIPGQEMGTKRIQFWFEVETVRGCASSVFEDSRCAARLTSYGVGETGEDHSNRLVGVFPIS